MAKWNAARRQYGYDRGEATQRSAVSGKRALHITLDSIGEAVLCTDVDMNVTFMNPVAEKMSGWSQEQAMSQPLLNVLRITFGESGPAMENIHSGDMSRTAIEQDVVLHCRTGGTYDIHYSVTPLSTLDGQNIGFVLVIQDVTESRKMLRQLSYSASHDALTHLANRVNFETHLKRLLKSVQELHQRHALVFIDLDRFKAVNDTAGHAAGDALLRELSSLMLSMLRSTDIWPVWAAMSSACCCRTAMSKARAIFPGALLRRLTTTTLCGKAACTVSARVPGSPLLMKPTTRPRKSCRRPTLPAMRRKIMVADW
jgi:PAS domain S-box-containing protein